MKKAAIFFLCICMAFALFCSCANQEQGDDGKLNIVATVFPPYDFARQIVGDLADVTMLLDPGTEVHAYDPSPRDIVTIESCDIFIYIGGESETWAEELLDDLENENIIVVRFMDCVELYKEETVEGMDSGRTGHTEEDEETEYDEHIWTSPKNAVKMAEKITEVLCQADPDNSEKYRKSSEDYISQLELLDDEYEEVCKNAKRNTVIFADRFPFRYLVEAYGINYYGAFPGCASETEPSAATVAFLIRKVQEEKIPAVFYTEFSNQKLADIICEATGAEKLMMHSCHNVSKDDFDGGVTYISLMSANLNNLKEALD